MGFFNIFKSGDTDGAKKSSFFSKKRIYPIDCFGTYSIGSNSITHAKCRGYKLTIPFIILIIVCIIATIA